MAKSYILLALFVVGGLASPLAHDGGDVFDGDMSIFFDHTIENASGRIVGGSVAAEGAYPWMIALTSGFTHAFSCGGSIITNRHVLTAAHCLPTFGPGTGILSPTTRVRVGTNVWNSGGQSYRIRDFRRHPENEWFIIKNDIGILISRDAIQMNSRVATIPLSTRFIPGGVPARVSGFGRVQAGAPLSERLMELRTTIVDGARCIREVAEKSQLLDMEVPVVDPTTQICAFTAVNEAVCNGDSGSPLVLDINQQIGIVSWGLPCARGAPDMYVRVSAFIGWINSVTEST